MTLRLAMHSDIHCEFYHDNDYSFFFDGLDTKGVDVAILAGDILVARNSLKFLHQVCERYPKVIHVAGNHEYYHGEFHATQRVFRNLKIPNYHFLENEVLEISGQRFVGSTLWYGGNPLYEYGMNDFRAIYCSTKPFRHFIYSYAVNARAFLNNNVQKNDVVITHMLPSDACVDEQYRGNYLNCFYVNNCEDIIDKHKPALWLHGHSHNSLDMQMYNTRIMRNPIGYPGEYNMKYNKNLIVEI